MYIYIYPERLVSVPNGSVSVASTYPSSGIRKNMGIMVHSGFEFECQSESFN